MKKINITEVVNSRLCCGCGTCVSLCNEKAIKIAIDKKKGIYSPIINLEKCNNCGICQTVCPRVAVDFNKLNLEIFGVIPNNFLLGYFLDCYLGYSKNEDIRFNSSSGGMITQLLIYILENKIVDGVLVTRMKKDNPLEPEPFIARSKEDIIEASKSKYCPVPANIALKEILDSKKGKFAVVGLPCHIHGVRKAEKYNKKLKERIVLHFGIFCSHTDSFKSTDQLLHVLGLNKDKIKHICYRGEGWPGKIVIKLKDDNEISISNQDILWNAIFNGLFFTPISCLLCNDLTAELSDISFGDPWLPEIMSKEKKGKSILISRTQKGDKLLKLAADKGFIELSTIDSNDVIKSQKKYLHFKKININERINIRNFFGKKSPQIMTKKVRSSLSNKTIAGLFLFNNFLGLNYDKILKFIPFKLLKFYFLAHSTLYSKITNKEFNRVIYENKKFNILIINAHWNNRGDEAAIRAMIESLKSTMPIKKIKIMFTTNIKFSYENIELLKTFPYSKNNISYLIGLFIDFFLNIITFGKLAFSKDGKKFICAINDADLVIHAPGGPSIGDLYSGILVEYFYLYRLFLAKIKGKHVYIYASSMGPFSGKIKNFIRRFVLKRMDIVVVRDKISKKYLENQLNLNSYLTLDSAFQNDVPKNYLNKYSDISEILNIIKSQKVVGMTITDLNWHPLYKNNISLKKDIIKSLENSIEYIIKEGYCVLLIPQLFGSEKELEKPLIDHIKSKNKNIFVLPQKLDSYAQQIVISNLFCVIGMRYHPNIFSAKMNIPSIAIYYEHKTKSFMEGLGRSDLIINVEEIDEKIIIDKFRYLEKNYDKIKKQISKKTPHLKEKSKKTTKLIINDLN